MDGAQKVMRDLSLASSLTYIPLNGAVACSDYNEEREGYHIREALLEVQRFFTVATHIKEGDKIGALKEDPFLYEGIRLLSGEEGSNLVIDGMETHVSTVSSMLEKKAERGEVSRLAAFLLKVYELASEKVDLDSCVKDLYRI